MEWLIGIGCFLLLVFVIIVAVIGYKLYKIAR